MLRRSWIIALLISLGACGGGRDAGGTAAASKDELSLAGLTFDTSEGAFTLILYPKAAPLTVERYLEYVDTGYFDGRSFGRVVPGFVIQVTDRLLGLTEDGRTLPLEPSFTHSFSAGALGIARGSSQNSGGPEFFVMDFPSSHLNTQYTLFGQVVEGMDVVRRIARVPAIDWSQTTGQAPLLFDRWAIEPPVINQVSHTTVSMTADEAARYPLQTAERFRGENHAHNLEWPANLAVGQSSRLTWYITDFSGEAPPPAANDVLIQIGGEQIPVNGDAEFAGIYSFDWVPAATGDTEAILLAAGEPSASLTIQVKR